MNDPDAIELLRTMLEIPSVSGDEARLAAFLVERMSRAGLDAAVDDAGNAVGVRTGPGEVVFDLVLLGHMDTVTGHVPVRVEGGRLYGRGAVDAKGPLAAFFVAAARASLPPGLRVTVAGAVEEETATSRGARHLASRLRPDACVIGEPSGWDAVTLGYKGRLLMRYRAERETSHSAGPAPTVAEEAVRWWNALEAFTRSYNRGRAGTFDQLQCGLRCFNTTSDGLIDIVEATVGFRLPPGFERAALEALARDLGDGATVECYGAEQAWRSDRTTPLAAPFLASIRGAGGVPRFKVKTGTSDMNVVGPVWRCPIVAYGPGDSRLDHTPNEHVEIAEYLGAIDVLGGVLEAMPIARAVACEEVV